MTYNACFSGGHIVNFAQVCAKYGSNITPKTNTATIKQQVERYALRAPMHRWIIAPSTRTQKLI